MGAGDNIRKYNLTENVSDLSDTFSKIVEVSSVKY